MLARNLTREHQCAFWWTTVLNPQTAASATSSVVESYIFLPNVHIMLAVSMLIRTAHSSNKHFETATPKKVSYNNHNSDSLKIFFSSERALAERGAYSLQGATHVPLRTHNYLGTNELKNIRNSLCGITYGNWHSSL